MPTFTIELPDTITRTIAGHPFEIDLSKVPAESVAYLARYGFRALTDASNSAAKVLRDSKGVKTNEEAGWLRKDSLAFVDALYDGSIAEKARRAAGTSTLDPIAEEVLKLVAADIIKRLGVKNWSEASDHAVGKKYFETKTPDSGKAYVARNVDALLDYAKRHDANAKPGNGYTDRATVIVNARGTVDPEAEVEL
jgi:hypothetical protein